MEIKKIGSLSEEEMTILTNAGGLLGSIKRSFESEEIVGLSGDATNLIQAVGKNNVYSINKEK